MAKQEQPKNTTNIIGKTVKTAKEQSGEIVKLPPEAVKELKSDRNKSSEETGDSLKKIAQPEADKMEKTNELYEQINQKNQYVAGATTAIENLKGKEGPLLPEGFPDKPVETTRNTTNRPPSEPEIKFPVNSNPRKKPEGPQGAPDKPVETTRNTTNRPPSEPEIKFPVNSNPRRNKPELIEEDTPPPAPRKRPDNTDI
ncbi:hypothetical protein HOC54_00905 [Candidatus Peregrinibacteria bacterium]|nr:hypothetical protein [Candidatus Peregrinibacteria bacterium]MBT4455686.1 hypothetical protein [Candidatus Peregrinibacteria bacterium]